MVKSQFIMTVVVVLLILSFTISSVAADAEPPLEMGAVDEDGDLLLSEVPTFSLERPAGLPNLDGFTLPDASVEEASSPEVIYPRYEAVYTKTPKFRFTEFPGATKYRIDVWNDITDELVYTFKGTGNCSAGECWLKPSTSLKIYDISGVKGQYLWRVRAKVNGEWPPLWSQATFAVLSTGFTSTFDLNANKWLALCGEWTVVSPGYLKTKGVLDTTASILRKELFTDGIVYEVTMKRKVEADTTNRVFFFGYPGETYTGGLWEDGYVFEYTNDGHWSLIRVDDYSKTYLVEEVYTDAIIPYSWNKLTIWSHYSNIHVWVNEQYLGAYTDSTYSEGWVGIGMFEGDAEKSPLLVDKAKAYYSDIAPYATP